MANVKDVVKEVIPVVAEIVSNHLAKEEKEKTDVMEEDVAYKKANDETLFKVGSYVGAKLAEELDAEEINNTLNDMKYSDSDKIREAYANGASIGFRLGVNTAEHVHSMATDALYHSDTLLAAVKDTAMNDFEFIGKALAAQNKK